MKKSKVTSHSQRNLVILGIVLICILIPVIYFFFLLPNSIYPIKTVKYSQATFNDTDWAMNPTNNTNTKLAKLPSNYNDINKYFHNSITTAQKTSLLQQGYVNIAGKYYQSFSSYYFDLLAAKVPVFVTSDSVMNYSYNMISTLRKNVVEKELIPIYTKWLNSGISYFKKLKTQKGGDTGKLCDTNISLLQTSKDRLTNNPTYETYIQSYTSLIEGYNKDGNTNNQAMLLLYNKRGDSKDYFSKILTLNSLFGISTNDLGLKVLDQEVASKIKTYKDINEVLKLEATSTVFTESENLDETSFYDSVFSNVENNWGDNTQYTYRKNIVGDIYTTNVEEKRWTNVKGLDSNVVIEQDLSTYQLLTKYFAYVKDMLKKEGVLSSDSKKLIENTSNNLSFFNTCSNGECVTKNKDKLLDFFKNAGAVNNLADQSSLLVTEGIFSFNNSLYVGPVFVSVGMNINELKGDVLGASLFGNFNSGYDYAVRLQPKGTTRIPVLMYHNISPVPTSGSASYRGLFVSPTMFAQQMAYLKQKGYTTITASQFLAYLKSAKNPTNKTVMITFDDGTRPQYTVAYPILKKYGLKAVYFIIADRLLIHANELKKMSDNGMDIESHSSSHPDLSKIGDPKRLKTELNRSKLTLEGITKKKIVSIAYPGCVGGTRVFNLLKTYGYQLGFSCGTTIDHYNKWWYNLSRVHVYSDMYRFKKALSWGL